MDTAKPVIEVHYYGDPPRVVLPPGMEAEVMLVDAEEAETRILTFEGVSIYNTYWKDDVISDHWYAPEPGLDSEDELAFDVRDLPEVPEAEVAKIQEIFIECEHIAMVWAIKQGWITADTVNIPKTA